MSQVSFNYQAILSQLTEHRVSIVAMTKYASDEQIQELYDLGLRDFAENYVQAALERINRCGTSMPEARWHFCGHLQKNKINKILAKFYLIQSIDSLELAKLISKRCLELGLRQSVLLQVNISGELSKTGFSLEQIKKDYNEILGLAGLKVRGLMTMAAFCSKPAQETEEVFRQVRELKFQLEESYQYPLTELSMGMSNDYHLAIKQAATMLRLGRVLFGEKLLKI